MDYFALLPLSCNQTKPLRPIASFWGLTKKKESPQKWMLAVPKLNLRCVNRHLTTVSCATSSWQPLRKLNLSWGYSQAEQRVPLLSDVLSLTFFCALHKADLGKFVMNVWWILFWDFFVLISFVTTSKIWHKEFRKSVYWFDKELGQYWR